MTYDKRKLEALLEKVKVEDAPVFRDIVDTFGNDVDDRAIWFELAYNNATDAAIALHEAIRPGWGWSMDSDGEAEIWLITENDGLSRVAKIQAVTDNSSPARALLIADLETLIAECEDD